MEASELIKKVRKIEIKTRSMSKHLFSGEYHSAFKGRGMSFSEVRGYQYGDDVRNIDWNVTARTGDPYIKIFEEERELSVFIIVDVSGSTYTGTKETTKDAFMTELSAVLSFSALQNNDKVGLLLFSDHIHKFIPPKKGKKHILRIIRELINQDKTGIKTDIGQALRYFNNVVKKRSIVFLLSDFYTQPDSFYNDIRVVAKKHDLIGVQILDRWDRQLPDVGLLKAHDTESGETYLIDTSDKKVRAAHETRFADKQEEMKTLFSHTKSDWLSLTLGEPYILPLLKFFKTRAAR